MAGTAVSFVGTASDVEDGVLTNSLVWTLDQNGEIGNGASFSISNLTVGTHSITASVTDSGGTTGSATISITITAAVNTAPEIMMLSPLEGDIYDYGVPINFGASALDLEDINLTSQIIWTSSIDGQIGTGGPFPRTLSPGKHLITASVTDSGGLTDSASVNITVNPDPNAATKVTVTNIAYSLEGGRSGAANLAITLTVINDKGIAVSGATVSVVVNKDNKAYFRGSGTTTADGKVKFVLRNFKSGTYKTTVTQVNVAGLTWDGITPTNSYTK
jgi:hypothetical protein